MVVDTRSTVGVTAGHLSCRGVTEGLREDLRETGLDGN